MSNHYENLPYQLRNLRQFCCWRYEKRNGKKTKVPYNPLTKKRAKPDRPDTFNDFNTALMAVNNYDGIGFLVGNDICAVDLDDCFDSNVNLKPIAQNIVGKFSGCYMEYSPSGKGLHIYFILPTSSFFS
jgi:putative DNA primase/helicase